ncbi:MAG: hypothetical protein H7Z21_19600 [Hymenobacter sp.]|nr:hypothetical protein [Hymenobacter sp.]
MKSLITTFYTSSRRFGVAMLTSGLLLGCEKKQVEPAAPLVAPVTADAAGDIHCPKSLPKVPGYPELECGCFEVVGLGGSKQAYVKAGATLNFLASAMMETDKMSTDYPDGSGKRMDSFNAGAAKQNWYMIRTSYPAFRGLQAKDYGRARQLNSNRKVDVAVYHAAIKRYGLDRFLAGHRNGQTGTSNPNTRDINRFRAAFRWTRDRIGSNSAYRINRVRFWVRVPELK